jgi:UDP-GlcNAc:undecaprenyl-phosphate/decaprenyl-phosphate GlcNAc-1-phosphate transferase
MNPYLALAIIAVTGFVASLLLVPLAAKAGMKLGFTDKPRPGEVGKRITPRTGGYGIIAAFFVALLVSLPLLLRFPEEQWRIAGFALGALAILPLAYMDDVRRLAPMPQLIGQFFIAAIPLTFGIIIDSISNPFGAQASLPFYIAVPFTLLWMIGMINTVNFVDTMDGLAAGIATIAGVVLFLVSLGLGQTTIAALPLILAATAGGFLVFNFHPAKVYMGTSGSVFLGYTLAIVSIIGGAKIATAALVLGVPILDVASVILLRLRKGRSPFQGGDGAHLPHRLMKTGMGQRQISLLLYLLCAIFGGLSLFLDHGEKFWAFGGMFVVLGLFVYFVYRRQAESRRETLPAQETGPKDKQ